MVHLDCQRTHFNDINHNIFWREQQYSLTEDPSYLLPLITDQCSQWNRWGCSGARKILLSGFFSLRGYPHPSIPLTDGNLGRQGFARRRFWPRGLDLQVGPRLPGPQSPRTSLTAGCRWSQPRPGFSPRHCSLQGFLLSFSRRCECRPPQKSQPRFVNRKERKQD